MSAFLMALPLMLNVACAQSPIRPDEAKVLAIHAARASGVPARFDLDAEEKGETDNTLTFRVFATNPDKNTAAMSLSSIRSFAFSGIETVPVEMHVQIASGLPAFLMVGPVTQRTGGWPQHG